MTGGPLKPALASRLAKVLGKLGSDHDGEVVAAGRRADRIVKDAGLTWPEVISAASSSAAAGFPPNRLSHSPALPARSRRSPVRPRRADHD